MMKWENDKAGKKRPNLKPGKLFIHQEFGDRDTLSESSWWTGVSRGLPLYWPENSTLGPRLTIFPNSILRQYIGIL